MTISLCLILTIFISEFIWNLLNLFIFSKKMNVVDIYYWKFEFKFDVNTIYAYFIMMTEILKILSLLFLKKAFLWRYIAEVSKPRNKLAIRTKVIYL